MFKRKFKSEGPGLYGRYQLGKCDWLELLNGDDPEPAYAEGFLPYSGRPENPRHLFYMARSLRVRVRDFGLSKGRRYDHRLWQSFELQRRVLDKRAFLEAHGHRYMDLAMAWMAARFGQPYLSPKRIGYVAGKPFLDTVICWYRGEALFAYALVVRCGAMAHYWYCFYRYNEAGDDPPGAGFLTDFLYWCCEEEVELAYLGTAYGKGSRYKSRGIAGVEFWNTNRWESSKTALAELQVRDDLVHA